MMTLWNWINGKKTVIGLVAKAVLKLMGQLKPDMMSTLDMLEGYVDIWILGGVTHKLAKMEN